MAFGAQTPWPPHVPATHMLDELHVSVSVPQLPQATVRVAPGVHDPVHCPARHWYGHAVPLVHCPLELHVCGILPEHCVAPGEHTPVHAPLAHTYWQLTGLPHCPFEPHVSALLPEHCVAPGLQTPEQHDPLPASPQPLMPHT